ncbi:hypothetical protein P175DRAFT_0556127 [Aspergillus ochraceoroseus IBT 24754]|uniref:HNH nuclease domain-containing protein n=1 Tax=Aspergillus ochraceoroseus IBT 24754 TaxID=1392256 RepID=A0A2T5M4M5_9EURO|nr:uncharacterized protein P175DRAFT_0556127 [Aspergillus ochraceoroseus IBT 24754]PTU23482.1 hypothetical protein P175DRAFT_0556127 [Aspergillus ochraceoroseus IBT 24754]
MDAIFGKTRTPELFSARNGLLISQQHLEEIFDCGKIVIVSDLPERPETSQLLKFLTDLPLRYGDLDNRRLHFRTQYRPAARYLYFHYCLQILRRAWQENASKKTAPYLKDEKGKPFWGTPGMYFPKNMLLALVEELGHGYCDLLEGASSQKGDNSLLLEVASQQVKRRRPLKASGLGTCDDSDDDEGSASSDDEYDENFQCCFPCCNIYS